MHEHGGPEHGSAPERKKSSTLKWVLFSLGAFVLLIGFWTALAVVWSVTNGEELLESMAERRQEAERIAEAGGAEECVQQSRSKGRRCALWNLNCQANVTLFVTACLRSAPDVADYCRDVPGPYDILESQAYTSRECSGQGWGRSTSCKLVAGAVQAACDQGIEPATR